MSCSSSVSSFSSGISLFSGEQIYTITQAYKERGKSLQERLQLEERLFSLSLIELSDRPMANNYLIAMEEIKARSSNVEHKKEALLRFAKTQLVLANLFESDHSSGGRYNAKEAVKSAFQTFMQYEKTYHDGRGFYHIASTLFSRRNISASFLLSFANTEFREEYEAFHPKSSLEEEGGLENFIAYVCLKKAEGYPLADLERVQCLLIGKGCTKNAEEAKDLLKSLASKGNSVAIEEYIRQYCPWFRSGQRALLDFTHLQENADSLGTPELISYARLYLDLELSECAQFCLDKIFAREGGVAGIRGEEVNDFKFVFASLMRYFDSDGPSGARELALFISNISVLEEVERFFTVEQLILLATAYFDLGQMDFACCCLGKITTRDPDEVERSNQMAVSCASHIFMNVLASTDPTLVYRAAVLINNFSLLEVVASHLNVEQLIILATIYFDSGKMALMDFCLNKVFARGELENQSPSLLTFSLHVFMEALNSTDSVIIRHAAVSMTSLPLLERITPRLNQEQLTLLAEIYFELGQTEFMNFCLDKVFRQEGAIREIQKRSLHAFVSHALLRAVSIPDSPFVFEAAPLSRILYERAKLDPTYFMIFERAFEIVKERLASERS